MLSKNVLAVTALIGSALLAPAAGAVSVLPLSLNVGPADPPSADPIEILGFRVKDGIGEGPFVTIAGSLDIDVTHGEITSQEITLTPLLGLSAAGLEFIAFDIEGELLRADGTPVLTLGGGAPITLTVDPGATVNFLSIVLEPALIPVNCFEIGDDDGVCDSLSTIFLFEAPSLAQITVNSNVVVTSIIEPLTLSLFGSGLLAIGFMGWRQPGQNERT